MRPEPLRILVIDDYPPMAKALGDVLEHDGYRILTRTSGIEGLQAFHEAHDHHDPFHIVITDFRMEALDGLAVAAAVKARHATTSVILLTAYPLPEGHAPACVDRVLAKPPMMRDLRAALATRDAGSGGTGRYGRT